MPPITPTTFEDYVIPFWFRESVFRQDANLGFLSNQKKSTQNTGVVQTSNILCNLFLSQIHLSSYVLQQLHFHFSGMCMGLFSMHKKVWSLAIQQKMLQPKT